MARAKLTGPQPATDEQHTPPAEPAVDEQPTPTEPPAAAPVATEPGCTHPQCVLEHPHAGPAVLDTPAAVDVDQDQALRRVVDARAELDAATAAVLPAAGYVIATAALHVPGGARPT